MSPSVPVVFRARANLFLRGSPGCSGHPAFPAPSFPAGVMLMHNSGKRCRESENAYSLQVVARSNATRQSRAQRVVLDCFASLAMTEETGRTYPSPCLAGLRSISARRSNSSDSAARCASRRGWDTYFASHTIGNRSGPSDEWLRNRTRAAPCVRRWPAARATARHRNNWPAPDLHPRRSRMRRAPSHISSSAPFPTKTSRRSFALAGSAARSTQAYHENRHRRIGIRRPIP